jgi:hypothetical protein
MRGSLWPCHDISGRDSLADAIVLLLAAMLLAGCILVPPPVTQTEPERSAISAQPTAEISCEPPSADVEIMHAAWAYVHERYPAQPWPDDVYLVGDRNVASLCRGQPIHVVLYSHATGFLWEGDLVWSRSCPCCQAQIEEIRELYAAMLEKDPVTPGRP